jgi:hypothetical protein
MSIPDCSALRDLVACYLAGKEPLETAVPRFADLFRRCLEAGLLDTANDGSPLAGFHALVVTDEHRRRMREFGRALVDYYPPSPIEYLPVEDPDEGDAQTGG